VSKKKNIYKSILGNDIIMKLFAFFIYLYLNLVYFTSRKYFIYPEKFNKKLYEEQNAIYAFWHNRIALIFFLKPKNINVNALISTHRDGKLIAYVSKLFKYKIIEGSTNKNAITSVKKIYQQLKKKEAIAITPDGPRGPVYRINSNIVKIASKASLASKKSLYIIPWSYASAKVKRFRSWDQFILPLPLSKVCFSFGNPIKVPKNISAEKIQAVNLELKQELDRISHLSENSVKL
jgi:lysophospholipid acyltransferase (LPLAT)-like uncharacterized protein